MTNVGHSVETLTEHHAELQISGNNQWLACIRRKWLGHMLPEVVDCSVGLEPGQVFWYGCWVLVCVGCECMKPLHLKAR